ncbi:hypothetical protein PCCS19_02380 [Paenibacillus sp. CCS19]|nr:hypothetical protein PCCS19_02380 [Paenibacillus cellulosilyticus]
MPSEAREEYYRYFNAFKTEEWILVLAVGLRGRGSSPTTPALAKSVRPELKPLSQRGLQIQRHYPKLLIKTKTKGKMSNGMLLS